MRKEILQQMIENNGEYLVGERYIKAYGSSYSKDTREAILLSPNIDRKLWNAKIGELPFDLVINFADEEIISTIHLGNEYPPFQFGIKRKDFINLKKVTCKPMELILKCYTEKITDYYKVLEVMEKLTTPPLNH